jgi:hypothetical protein
LDTSHGAATPASIPSEETKVFYILFDTLHDVLKAEKLLKSHHLDVEVVPVPRKISSDCGVSIKSRSPVESLFGLLGEIRGVKCYIFDGVQYKAGRSHSRKTNP